MIYLHFYRIMIERVKLYRNTIPYFVGATECKHDLVQTQRETKRRFRDKGDKGKD